MRLRYLAVDHFHEASRSSREEYLRHVLPLPVLTSLEEEFLALSKSNGVVDSCHQSLFDSSSPKLCPELPQDFPWFEETKIYDKFLSEIFPDKVPCQPSIDLGEGVTNRSQLVHWLCSDMKQIQLQVQKEDDNRISNGSQTVGSSIICEVAAKSMTSDNVPHLSCSWQSTFRQHVNEQKPGSFVSDFPSIETPQVELKDCIPQPDCWRIILGLGFGGAQLSTIESDELVALPKVHVPKAWFDILPLPCSPERWKNESTTAEARFNDIHELRRIDEACRSRRQPRKINDLIANIMPIEIPMIPENVNGNNRGEKEMTFSLKPTCLLQWFESHEGKMEKEAHNLPTGGFNHKKSLEESLTSKLVYHEEYIQLAIFPPGLVCEQCGPQPSSVPVMDSATDPPHGIMLTFEIPSTCDWSSSSLAETTPCIIAAHESESLVPDLPRLKPSQSFESAVVLPELALDDQQFQFLPVPVVTCPQELYMIDADFGRLVSLNCQPCAVPATDWLYLDWHFFHGLKCTNAACFSLQAHLIKEAECQPLPSTSLITEIVKSQKGSKFTVELRLLENNDSDQDNSAIRNVTGATGEKIEAAFCSAAGEISQTRVNKSYRPPVERAVEIQKPREREYEILLQTPCFDFRPDIDKIAENGFLPACNVSNSPQNHHTSGVEGGIVGSKVQATKCNPDAGRMGRPHLQNMQPVERFMTSTSAHNKGGYFQRKSQEGQPSNDPVLRDREMRSTSLQSGSDSIVNDFDFFVRARKGIPVGSDMQIIEEPQNNSSKVVNKPALSITPGRDNQDHNTEVAAVCEHEVEISMEIRKCLVSLSSDYFALLAMEEILELKTPGDLESLKQFGFDGNGNSYLTSLISNMADEPVSHQRQTVLRGLIALHVLRHTAKNLCSYGIQVGHLYLENCFEKMHFLEGYIMDSRTELEEAYDNVERGMVEDHPKLCYLDKLLGPVALERHRTKYSSVRILLLADRRAFFTLVRKLVSLGLTPYQIDRKENYLHNGVLQEDSQEKLKAEISEALTFSDCLLVSYAYVNSSFPVQGFTMIIQYADSPKIGPPISSWTKGRCVIHLFKVLLHSEMKCSGSSSQRQADCQIPQAHNLSNSTPLFRPNIAFGPSADQSLSESSTRNQNVPPSEHERTTHSSSRVVTKQIPDENRSSERRCEMIIVANISHPNDHMLTGRRSSYQKILQLEKENLQVVERESRLPIDLILSPAACIVVYTLGKLNLERHNLKDKQETLQNEVLTHLKAISFSFRDCIMIFEGPTEFTKAALQISTQIYTLAFALDMQFQCFGSRHPVVTDTILIHSIQAVRRSKHVPSYPIMTEGPTLAEAFLTGFPSINSLTAHAILSSACPLPLFMSYSLEQQYAAVEPYEVPKHCLELFKAQCTFTALATTAVWDCKGIEAQTDEHDVRIPYQHQADAPVVRVDVPSQASRSEVWSSFPEFPPASAISEDYPTYSFRDINPVDRFPDFPPVSEISSQADCSIDLYGVINNLKRSPAEVAPSQFNPSQRDDVSLYRGARRQTKAQEIYAEDDTQMFSKGSGSADFQSGGFPNGLENNFEKPLNPRASQYEMQHHPFQLGKRHWPWVTSESANGSKRLGGAPEKLHGGHKILQDAKEPIRRPQLGIKRGASSVSSIPPTVYAGRQEMGLSNALGSWNEHKRVRGVNRQFMTDAFDLQDIDGSFTSRLPLCPNGIEEFPPAPRPDWLETSPSAHEETNLNPRSGQSKRPQATLNISSLDRFRYQSNRPAPTDFRGNRAKRGLSRRKVVSARRKG